MPSSSYAGLHCVVIKGYSKSAGYQPGVKFEGNRFRNSWNAVYVAGAWRFVQCNWGARHLVSVAVMQGEYWCRPTGSWLVSFVLLLHFNLPPEIDWLNLVHLCGSHATFML